MDTTLFPKAYSKEFSISDLIVAVICGNIKA